MGFLNMRRQLFLTVTLAVSLLTITVMAQQTNVRYEPCGRCNGTGKNICQYCGGNRCPRCNYSGVVYVGDGWAALGMPNGYSCPICKGKGKTAVDTRFDGCFRTFFDNDKGYLCGDAHPIGRVVIVDDYVNGKVLKTYTRAEWDQKEADDKARKDSVAMAEKTKKEDDLRARGITNKRDQLSIRRTISQKKGDIYRAYDNRRRGLNGEITVKFTISESGKVVSVQMEESTIKDSEFETLLVNDLKHWDFGKINETRDITEVTWSFTFPR
jgi:TonB family protein